MATRSYRRCENGPEAGFASDRGVFTPRSGGFAKRVTGCQEIGDKKLLNMVAVGALLTALPEITTRDVEKALEGHLPARHKHLLPKNYKALKRGFEEASRVPA